ncbi:hypothetical protein Q1M63_24560 [Sinorhizobium meliloti]|nr:hypothetical protein Q1M63_24560 [Sinorhizobium meliloti]
MTPAERARIIDKEEFAAECAAIRQRAHAYVERRRHEARADLAHWLGRPAPVGVFKPDARPAIRKRTVAALARGRDLAVKRHTIDGLTMTKRQWADHLGITYSALNTRVSRLGSLEAAVRPQANPHAGRRRRRSSVTVAGISKSIAEWADYIGMSRTTLYHRIKSEAAETVIANLLDTPPGGGLEL